MKIDILTLFPEMFDGVLSAGVIGRAAKRGLLEFRVTNIRDYTVDKHRKADDYPFGGGAGQLMSAQPIFAALKSLGEGASLDFGTPRIEENNSLDFGTPRIGDLAPICRASNANLCESADFASQDPVNCSPRSRRIYLSPRGRLLDKGLAEELAGEATLVLLCGHYEGVDQRVLDAFDFEEVSIGDYILTGGELASMVLIDTVCRLVPGVLGSEESHAEESVYSGLLEYPQYTRPEVFEGMNVPAVLISGDHQKIALWNFEQALALTAERRPDLLRAWLAAHFDELDKQRKKLAEPYYEAMMGEMKRK